MRILVVGLLLLGGCSWLTARAPNNPRVGCTRTPGRIDAGVALISAGLVATAIIYRAANPITDEGDHGNKALSTGLAVTSSATLGIIEAIQAAYGLRVADRCQAERAKLTMTTAPGSL